MKVEIYLDDKDTPYKVITPPEKFKFDSTEITDGPHFFRFSAIDENGIASERRVDFFVRNGPAITVHGIVDGDRIAGEIDILTNAYGSKSGDEFEPVRMETPVPIPMWAWIIFLLVIGWGAGYITLTYNEREMEVRLAGEPSTTENTTKSKDAASDWSVLGEQVYGNNCSSCHQANGSGLPNVFPPLVNNAVVIAEDPSEHILAILNGVQGKVIDGVNYASPMPGFGGSLSDEEVAAVVNHERTNWGNNGKVITSEEVAALRK